MQCLLRLETKLEIVEAQDTDLKRRLELVESELVLREYFGCTQLHDSYHGAQLNLEILTRTSYVPSYVHTTCSSPCWHAERISHTL
jgi:hypothetical protein